MVRGVTYALLQPVRFHTLMLYSFHSYCFVIKKGTKVSVKQSSKIGLNLWLILGNLSVVWWLCSFQGWRFFRQKKSKCKILTFETDLLLKEMLLRYALNIITSQSDSFFPPHFYFIFKNVPLWNSMFLCVCITLIPQGNSYRKDAVYILVWVFGQDCVERTSSPLKFSSFTG